MAKADDWWRVLKHLFAGPSPAISPLGKYLDAFWPGDGYDISPGLLRFGLAVHDMGDGDDVRRCLVVPAMSDPVAHLFDGTAWSDGSYWQALQKAPGDIVIRERGGAKHVIGNVSMLCVFVDLVAWDEWCESHVPLASGAGAANEQLKQYIERWERLDEEREAIVSGQKDVMAEAKATGFDTTAMRAVIRRRKQDPAEVAELDSLIALYEAAVGGRVPLDDD